MAYTSASLMYVSVLAWDVDHHFCVFTGLSQHNKYLMEVKYKVQLAVLGMICTLAHSERSVVGRGLQ